MIKSVVVDFNDKGECVKVSDILTLTSEQIKAYKEQANNLKANEIAQNDEIKEKKNRKLAKEHRKALVLAKYMFDHFVECGHATTNEQFEKDFDDFLLGVKALDLANAPLLYKQLVGGID